MLCYRHCLSDKDQLSVWLGTGDLLTGFRRAIANGVQLKGKCKSPRGNLGTLLR